MNLCILLIDTCQFSHILSYAYMSYNHILTLACSKSGFLSSVEQKRRNISNAPATHFAFPPFSFIVWKTVYNVLVQICYYVLNRKKKVRFKTA